MQQDVAFLEQQCTIKTKGENVMFVNPELHGKNGKSNLMRTSEKPLESMRKRKRTPGSPRYHLKAGNVRELLTDKQGVAALRLYSFLAEHIDPSCGAVVADQQFLADKMGVNRSTIIRWLNYLESKTHWLGSLLQERSAHMH